MTVKLPGEVHWIGECMKTAGKHIHTSAYLIEIDNEYILIDTGAFYHQNSIRKSIKDVVGSSTINTMVISKAHAPHSGNLSDLRDEWGDPDVVGTSGVPALYGLPNAIKAAKSKDGETMEIANRELTFIDPPLIDVGHSTWIYDQASKTLFTADGLGHYHADGQCKQLSNDMTGGIRLENIKEFHEDMLLWLKYIDPDKLTSAIEAVFEMYEIESIAPIHGNPVMDEDIDNYLSKFSQSVSDIVSESTLPPKS